LGVSEKHAIRTCSKDGKTIQAWDLKDFLRSSERSASAKTGSTLQWFEEGVLADRMFYFKGPARQIRGLSAPYTVMRGADDSVYYSASIDLKTNELKKDKGRRSRR